MIADDLTISPLPDTSRHQRLPNREEVRARVGAHLDAKRAVEELDIARNRPDNLQDFAFVGKTPKRSSQSEWYRCSFCETDRKFSSGRIVLSTDGLLRLIGDECWEKHLDHARYEEERQDWRDYQRRQQFDRLRERLQPLLTETIQQLNNLLLGEGETFKFIENIPNLLASKAPALAEQLQQSRRAGGQLRVERYVLDYAAMEREGRERHTTRTETIHTVLGLGAISGTILDLRKELQFALDRFLAARNAIAQTEWEKMGNAPAARAIGDIEANIRSGIDAADRAKEVIGNASDFLSERNIAGMVRWSTDSDSEMILYGRLSAIQGGFSFVPENGNPFDLHRPQSLKRSLVPDLAKIRELI